MIALLMHASPHLYSWQPAQQHFIYAEQDVEVFQCKDEEAHKINLHQLLADHFLEAKLKEKDKLQRVTAVVEVEVVIEAAKEQLEN